MNGIKTHIKKVEEEQKLIKERVNEHLVVNMK
jgi:hypothetical protein